MPVTNLVANLWIRSRWLISATRFGEQAGWCYYKRRISAALRVVSLVRHGEHFDCYSTRCPMSIFVVAIGHCY